MHRFLDLSSDCHKHLSSARSTRSNVVVWIFRDTRRFLRAIGASTSALLGNERLLEEERSLGIDKKDHRFNLRPVVGRNFRDKWTSSRKSRIIISDLIRQRKKSSVLTRRKKSETTGRNVNAIQGRRQVVSNESRFGTIRATDDYKGCSLR